MDAWEHIREAERLLANAERHITEDPRDMRISEVTAYAAQVHATLAVALNLAIEFDPTAVMDRVVTNLKDHEAARVTRPRNRVEWPPGRGAS